MIVEKTHIFIHTTDADYNKVPSQFLAVNRWHRDRWNKRPDGTYMSDIEARKDGTLSSLGYYGGYHTIADNGREFRFREDHEVASAIKGWANFKGLHHTIAFDGDIQLPRPADVEITRKRILTWAERYNIPLDLAHIAPHRRLDPNKTCYGSLLADDWAYRLIVTTKKDIEATEKKKAIEDDRKRAILDEMYARLKELQILLELTKPRNKVY